MRYVISFFDYTGHAVREYAKQGYSCICYDIQHPIEGRDEVIGQGIISYRYADLSHNSEDWSRILNEFTGSDIRLVFGFPPCTDLASSGAKHWEKKRTVDPKFQEKAVEMAKHISRFADAVNSPYCLENPNGALSTLWRSPDFKFDPCDFGGHPTSNSIHATLAATFQRMMCIRVGHNTLPHVTPTPRRQTFGTAMDL